LVTIQVTGKNQKWQINSAISHHKTTTIITAHSTFRANLNKKSGSVKNTIKAWIKVQSKINTIEILETWAHQSSCILRRPQNFAKSSPYFCPMKCQSKARWRFCKVLWPSQNIWTLHKTFKNWYFTKLSVQRAHGKQE
jgi:hypothetical protein